MYKTLMLVAVLVAFSATSFGQLSATADVGAKIIAPIAINKNIDLYFGSIIKGTAVSTVQITPGGVRSILVGDAALSAVAPAATAARFTITGEGGLAYTITLPPAAVTINSGVPTMTVDNFAGDVGPIATFPAGAGTQTQILNVGAVLNVGANQASGTYTGTFSVSVNYN